LSVSPEITPSEGLTLVEVSRAFGARQAVDGVSLSVGRSEVLCILGASGCGKSTTLRIAAGLERADSGRVYVAGQLVEGDDGKGYRHVPPEQRGVGLMFQDYALFPHLSVLGNVAFGLKGLPRAERMRRAGEQIARVGLSHLENAFPHTLSGGEQQRIALARMLAPHPKVVLMDEPFSGLDSSMRESVRKLTLKHLREAGTAVVIVTHDPDEAMRIGDRVVLMRAGKVVQAGTPLDLYARPNDPAAAALLGGTNRFHAEVKAGFAASPFGAVPASGLVEGSRAEIFFRAASLHIAEEGALARILAVRPSLAGIEVEAELLPGAVPDGVEAPETVLAAAPSGTRLSPGAQIRLAAAPGEAFVFPCLDKGCRA
jgi:iron(III) transport system ATP-binding protein